MSRKNELTAPVEGLYRDKGSKFLAYLFPIAAEEEVAPHLENLRKTHPAARHWCYAWRLGEEGDRYRINDDGEPSGSAGRPILHALDSAQLSQVLAVVVRYFGGTLLGVRGLIDAYSGAVNDALRKASLTPLTHWRHLTIRCNYTSMAALQSVMNELHLKPNAAKYAESEVVFEFKADEIQINALQQKTESVYGVNVV